MKRPILAIILILNIFLVTAAFASEKAEEPPAKPELIQSVEKVIRGRTLKNPEIDSVSVFISPVRLQFKISF